MDLQANQKNFVKRKEISQKHRNTEIFRTTVNSTIKTSNNKSLSTMGPMNRHDTMQRTILGEWGGGLLEERKEERTAGRPISHKTGLTTNQHSKVTVK